jgi:acyl-CoA thioester hydrolase
MQQHGEDAAPLAPTLAGTLTDEGHVCSARIYYADTDFSGFVYHARYLEFFERGRSDCLRLSGIGHIPLAEGAFGEPLVWVVRRMEIDFLAPARIDDIIMISTRTVSISGARIEMKQVITRDGMPLVTACVEAVLVTPAGRPRRLPKDWAGLLMPKAA